MLEQILVVDDEEGIRSTLTDILQDEGYGVLAAEDAAAARRAVETTAFDLAILDIWLPDEEGLGLLEFVLQNAPACPVIMISGHGNIDIAVKAIRIGAYDFLEKPLSLSRVVLTVEHALEKRRMSRELETLATQLERREMLIGDSPRMQQLKEQLAMAARSDSRILIAGENGTGKELVARQIHALSPRASKPFVDVNCAAIPEELIESELFGHVKGAFTGATSTRRGRFEHANGGTLFLDEIADMSLKTQAKVLRVLQEQRFERVGSTEAIQVDVRVLAATNKNLEEEIEHGTFREDLYFRLAVIPLEVPPLRERRADIPMLVQHFLDQFATELGRRPKHCDQPALDRLSDYSWPGNVRELRNLCERLMIMVPGQEIAASDLPANLRSESTDRLRGLWDRDFPTLKEARDEFEKSYIERKLQENGGNVTRTAEALGLERSNLHRKLKAYSIEVERVG
jgi:two-component system nitrogen regulation response regulator NtrX